ncbi:MAG TPA: nitroreductase [Negativicutes bacterium]|nr:nitroreductase [Negativicutes bacterium]
MNRKEFLWKMAASALIAGSALTGYSYMQLGPINELRRKKESAEITGLGSDQRRIIELASLAPSGHNTQPWRLKINQLANWTLTLAPERLLPVVDPDQRESWLSVGAFLENLTLAANDLGYDAEMNPSSASASVDVILKSTTQKPFPLEKIEQRRTLKKNFLSRALSNKDLSQLLGKQATECDYFPLESTTGKFLSELTLEANRLQVQRDDAQGELADWIRWTRQDAAQHQNGLTPAGMEMPDWLRWYAQHFISREDVLGASFREQTLKMAEQQVRQGAGWLILFASGSTIADLVATGRNLQSIWLRAKENNIAIHPMTQALEEATPRKMLAASLGRSGPVQFILRLGYVSEYLPPVSPRMPLSKILH